MKPYESLDAIGVLPSASCRRQARRYAAGSVRLTGHDLDQPVLCRMVEVVQADDAFGSRGGACELGDGVRGRVGGQDRVGAADLVETLEHGLLYRQILEDRLDHEVDVAEILEARRAGDPGENRGGVGRGEDAALDAVVQRLLDDAQAARDLLVIEVNQRDAESFGRHLLRDAAPHVAGADDGEAFEGPIAGRDGVTGHDRYCV